MLKDEAEFYRIALEINLVSVAEVVAWCDGLIMAHDLVDTAVIETSLSGSEGLRAVANALRDIEGDINKAEVKIRLLRLLREIINRDRSQAGGICYVVEKDLDPLGYGLGESEPQEWERIKEFFWVDFFNHDEPDFENLPGIEEMTNRFVQLLERTLKELSDI